MNSELYLGDCRDYLSDFIKEGRKVDLTITSPPYDELRTYDGIIATWNEDVWKQTLDALYEVTADGGVVVWVTNDATINGSESLTSFKQMIYAQSIGFNIHDTMIWNKGCFSAVGHTRVRYAPVFDYMFVLSKGKPKTFNPLKDRPNKHAGVVRHGTLRKDTGDCFEMNKKTSKVIGKYGQRFNIWDISPQRQWGKSVHPAPFPVAIAKDHILSWTNPGDVVLDPFMGSGTTGVACHETGRCFIGVELSTDYYAMAQERLRDCRVPAEKSYI